MMTPDSFTKLVKQAYESGYEDGKREGFKKGVQCAAEIADSYNSSTTHTYMLGDCILGKLNQITKKKIRKNKQAIKKGE